MILVTLAIAALLCALLPAILFAVNLRLYVPPPPAGDADLPAVSVLIPARNEASGIVAAVRSVLASTGVEMEVIVMDDASTDGTGDLVASLMREDSRVRLERAPTLPTGWNGKQHACWALARAAAHPVLCFVDADVRLEPECVARMAAFLSSGDQTKPLGLVSGFPRQVTGTWLEAMLLPLIHFVLLGFLPVARMRFTVDPALAAGCGQFLMAWKEDYFFTGGHSQIKETMHDGLLLPRLFRHHGYRTDLADLMPFAQCRMYTNATQVWQGLAKNATEGLAAPTRILPVTLLLLLGQVVPFIFLGWVVARSLLSSPLDWMNAFLHAIEHPIASSVVLYSMAAAACAAWLTRALAAARFRQSWLSALFHPIGIILLLAVQWYALTRKLTGGKVSWKERAYVKE